MDVCPDDVRGFDDGDVVLEDFEVRNNHLYLSVKNEGNSTVELDRVNMFLFVEEYSDDIDVSETIEPGDAVEISPANLEPSNDCNDIPVELFYSSENSEHSAIGSISAHMKA